MQNNKLHDTFGTAGKQCQVLNLLLQISVMYTIYIYKVYVQSMIFNMYYTR